MTQQQAKSFLKEYWQPLVSVGTFIFACGMFYSSASAQAERVHGQITELKAKDDTLEKAMKDLAEKQTAYLIDAAVTKQQLVDINKNLDLIRRGGR